MTNARREMRCESILEKKIAMRLLTDSRVVSLEEQPAPVSYRDADGKECKHYFDFLATMNDGRRIAIAVRPEKRAEKVRSLLPMIAADSKGFADAMCVMTERKTSKASVTNAQMILSARRGIRPAHDAVVIEVIAGIEGCTTIGDLVAMTGLHGDGFRAVVRAIDRGDLKAVSTGELGYDTVVEHVASEGENL